MGDITVRRTGQVAPTQEWDPFRTMRELMRWDPYREMVPAFRPEPAGFYPAFDVKESKEGYLFQADLPGFKSEDLHISMEGSRLQVSGKREAEFEEKTDTYYASERSFGSFMRSFTLPAGADSKNVRAELRDGVLTISIGRSPESKPRSIPIHGAAKASS